MKIVKRILIGLFILLMLLGVWVIISPYPVNMVIRMLFHGGVAVAPENYDEIVEQVDIKRNVSYDSQYKKGKMDIISPKNQIEDLPVIIWVHGGGFVGGDKSDIEEYAVQIAHEGYVVVNINYALAPEAKYPTPVLQLGEVYQFLLNNQKEYQIDMTNLFLAGDSAGAHIVGQFSMIQTENSYAELVGIDPVMNPEDINAVLLFCGPFDLMRFMEITENNAILKFFVHRILWGYAGIEDAKDQRELKEISLIDYVSGNFPPSFITDGNTYTFTEQGKNFSEKLQQLGVEVVTVFYDTEDTLLHEYQFMMDNEYSYMTYKKVLQFLQQYSNDSEPEDIAE